MVHTMPNRTSEQRAEAGKESSSEKKMLGILTAITEIRDAQQRLEGILSRGPAAYYFKTLGEYITGLFSLSRFKIGDAVRLAHDVDCNNKPGWVGSAHFLKAGATAVVSDLDFGEGGFRYGIVFDNETWWDDIDKKKTPRARPVSMKHEYWFGESDLLSS